MDTRTKQVSLEFIGEAWNECFIEMRYPTWADTKKMIESDKNEDFIAAMVERIGQVFISGQVLDKGQPVPLTKAGIAEFDIEALKRLNNAALGYPDPKE